MAKKGKRVKSGKPAIRMLAGWGAVDVLVRRIGDLQRDIEKAEAKAQARINRIKEDLAEDLAGSREGIAAHIASIEAFATAHRAELKGSQSRELNFGKLGWRRSSKVSVKKGTVDLIKVMFGRAAEQYLHIKESPDKEALAKLTDEQLSKVGARRKRKEEFYVEPFTTEGVGK